MEIKAKKSLGQNFLIDKNIINKIVNAGNVKNINKILEIGPGTGNLTEYIIKKNPKKFYVIEKDKNLVNLLIEKFGDKINIINKDVLSVSENLISKEELTVFGNLPYNISTQILSKWITEYSKKIWYKKLILLFQKEVADRILAKTNTKKYGRLSILSNWNLNVEKIMDISPSCFFPKPKIYSSLLIFTPKKKIFKLKNPKNLEFITRIFFNQRRKKIKKPFGQVFKNSELYFKKLNINPDLRPQNLSPETYYLITAEFENLR